MATKLSTKEAVSEINALIDKFNVLQSEIKGTGTVSASSFRTVKTGLQGLNTVVAKTNTAFKNLSKSQKSYVTQTRNLKTKVNQLTAANNKLVTSLKNKKKALGGVQTTIASILGAFGITGLIQEAINLGRVVFDTVRGLESLNFAMKATITDAYELGQTKRWLGEITKKFGAELITTTERYVKFRSAARSAGMTAKATQKIFETMTEASGTLGLKTDELKGIYLALEQMISKGKITTEELRRQLGERLPGAMDIMAKSIGVTTAELDEMMKKGEIITKDVLPAFADEVRKTFGLSGNEIDTLNASMSRFTTSWQQLINDIEGTEGGISSIFKGLFDSYAFAFESFSDLNTVLSDKTISTWDKMKTSMAELFYTMTPFWGNASKELADHSRAVTRDNAATKELMILYAALRDELELDVDMGQAALMITSLTIEEKEALIDTLKKQLSAEEEVVEEKKKGVAKQRQFIDYIAPETVKWYKMIIKHNEELISLSKDNADINTWQEENLKYLKEIDRLLNKFDENALVDVLEPEDFADDTEIITNGIYDMAIAMGYSEKKAEELLAKYLATYGATVDGVLELQDLMIKAEMEKAEWEKQNLLDSVDFIGDISDGIFEKRLANIDAEIQAETDKYDALISAAQNNEDEQARLEEEKAVRLEALRRRKEREEKKAFLISQGIAASTVIIQTALAAAAALAPPPIGLGPLAGPALLPQIYINGALALGSILAQTIPAFKDGVENLGGDTLALINDGGKKEYVERNGKILSTDTENAIVGLKKGDTVHKDYDSMVKSKSGMIDIAKATALANLTSQVQGRDITVVLDEQLGSMKKDIKNGIKQGFNQVALHSHTTIDLDWQMFKNDTL